jgi:outer membrane usher protein
VAAEKRHDLHGEPEPAGRLGRVLSQRPYLRLLEPLRDREAVSGQLQQSFGRLSWSASAQRVYTPDSSGHRRDDRISLNFSYPLWFGDNRTANLTSNTSFNNSRFASSQIGINGSLDSENNLNYGVSTTTATGGQHDVALNGSYRTPWTTSTAAIARAKAIVRAALAPAGR